MFSPTFAGLGKRFALLGVLTALAMGLLVSSALAASVSLSTTTPTSGQEITVTADSAGIPGEPTFAAIASCNVQGIVGEEKPQQEQWGKRCNHNLSETPKPRFTAPEELNGEGKLVGIKIVVEDSFLNFDFTTQKPGTGSTICKETGSEQCAVVASFYKVGEKGPEFLGAAKQNITFP